MVPRMRSLYIAPPTLRRPTSCPACSNPLAQPTNARSRRKTFWHTSTVSWLIRPSPRVSPRNWSRANCACPSPVTPSCSSGCAPRAPTSCGCTPTVSGSSPKESHAVKSRLARPKCTVAVPGDADGYPETFTYNDETATLHVGAGEFAPVAPDVYAFEVSGLKVVQSWLKYRMKKGAGRKSSPLDDIRPTPLDQPVHHRTARIVLGPWRRRSRFILNKRSCLRKSSRATVSRQMSCGGAGGDAQTAETGQERAVCMRRRRKIRCFRGPANFSEC